jgi:hypothetical protein
LWGKKKLFETTEDVQNNVEAKGPRYPEMGNLNS